MQYHLRLQRATTQQTMQPLYCSAVDPVFTGEPSRKIFITLPGLESPELKYGGQEEACVCINLVLDKTQPGRWVPICLGVSGHSESNQESC